MLWNHHHAECDEEKEYCVEEVSSRCNATVLNHRDDATKHLLREAKGNWVDDKQEHKGSVETVFHTTPKVIEGSAHGSFYLLLRVGCVTAFCDCSYADISMALTASYTFLAFAVIFGIIVL